MKPCSRLCHIITLCRYNEVLQLPQIHSHFPPVFTILIISVSFRISGILCSVYYAFCIIVLRKKSKFPQYLQGITCKQNGYFTIVPK